VGILLDAELDRFLDDFVAVVVSAVVVVVVVAATEGSTVDLAETRRGLVGVV